MIEKILDISKRRGIVYPSFEIYGGVSGFVDYGPIGVRIKQNLEALVRRCYVVGGGCLEVECPILSPSDVWVASGHIENFTDLMTECVKCGEPYRADHLILENTGESVEGKGIGDVGEILKAKKIKCPKCDSPLGELYDYNLMFATNIGPGKYKTQGYLRPETAQTTYLGFRRLWEFARKKLPFGVLQIGRSFRNEISPRQGMVRLREFNQAEIQFLYDPENPPAPALDVFSGSEFVIVDKKDGEHKVSLADAVLRKIIESQYMAYHLGLAFRLFTDMGIDAKKLRLRQHRDDERSFYSKDTWDVEYLSDSFGLIELVGIADRGDHDLSAHMKLSKQDMSVNLEGRKFVPHVLEVAYGIDRPFYCVLESCFKKDNERTYFAFPPKMAPYLAAVFPLVKKDGVAEKAREVYKQLTDIGLLIFYDESGSIGRRYARADEVGVPYAVTVDYDTLDDNTVTVRYRDSKKQDRVNVDKLLETITK